MIEITGLWVNEDKNGKKYMVGYMGSAKILIFKNDHKTDEKHPDYRLMLAEKQNNMATEEAKTEKLTDVQF